VDDVVQDTLRIVYEKSAGEALPDIAWSFQVLRNTIGNLYQKQRVRARDLPPEHVSAADAAPTPLEALEREESTRKIRECLRTLQRSDAPCTRYLERLMEGASPAEIAAEESVTASVLYRRVYRCRAKFRMILRAQGVLA
jgi:RNA polymerase sigma factor (sigma-70 family)